MTTETDSSSSVAQSEQTFHQNDRVLTPSGKVMTIRRIYEDGDGVTRIKLYSRTNNCYLSRRRLTHCIREGDWERDRPQT